MLAHPEPSVAERTPVSSAESVMNPPRQNDPVSIPHHVYDELVRGRDELYGANPELRVLIDSLAGMAPVPSPTSQISISLQAMINVVVRELDEHSPISDSYPRVVTRLVR